MSKSYYYNDTYRKITKKHFFSPFMLERQLNELHLMTPLERNRKLASGSDRMTKFIAVYEEALVKDQEKDYE